MAQSPSHLFGQIIGDLFESTFSERLRQISQDKNLYLDQIGPRSARKGKKVTWLDRFGSSHDLDFVIERGGSEETIGKPVAFIESAWRRYTKHSKNKAQEIQGAVLPLYETYINSHPFLGAILAGEFTGNALQQLKAQGFKVLHIPYQQIVRAFEVVGIDASWEEGTSMDVIQGKINQWNLLGIEEKQSVSNAILENNEDAINEFFVSLNESLDRFISRVVLIPLYGKVFAMSGVEEAIQFINDYSGDEEKILQKFEVEITYNNGDTIRATFNETNRVESFLKMYQ